jgi:hypothetical protein
VGNVDSELMCHIPELRMAASSEFFANQEQREFGSSCRDRPHDRQASSRISIDSNFNGLCAYRDARFLRQMQYEPERFVRVQNVIPGKGLVNLGKLGAVSLDFIRINPRPAGFPHAPIR